MPENTNYINTGNEGVNRTFRRCKELEREVERLRSYVKDQPCDCFDEYGYHRPQWFRDKTWMCDRCQLVYGRKAVKAAGGD